MFYSCVSKDDFYLLNHYAVKLLESAGNHKPAQKEINFITDSLVNIKKQDLSETLFTTLISRRQDKGKILLIENDPILFRVHYILLSNYGFSVDVATTMKQIISKRNRRYNAILARPESKGLNGWMGAMVFQNLPLKMRPKIYLLLDEDEEEGMCKAFRDRGASAIFKLPLNMSEFLDYTQ